MSKLSKISKIPKFPKLTKIPNHSYIIIFFLLFFLLAPNVTVPVVLQAEACPFASSSTAVPVHHRLNILCVQKSQPFPQMGGGGKQMGTLGKNGAWGDATCTCPRICVSRPCSSLFRLPVSWLCRFGCPLVQWCPVGRTCHSTVSAPF